VPADERPVPAQDRLGGDEEGRPALPWYKAGQGSDECSIGLGEPGSCDLAVQDGQLLTKHQDLRILSDGIHVVDAKELDDPTDQAIEEAECHSGQDRRSDRAWSSSRSGCWTLQDGPAIAGLV